MPRGSRPGERRGGRQRGTPNKKTLIKDAVFYAAASNPNQSPREFMLALMRDPQVPIDLRLEIAAAVAPFVHPRPEPARKQRPDPIDLRDRLVDTGDLKFQRLEAKPAAEGGGAGDLSPLDFLLGVMNDPAATPRQRVKAAGVAARYTHAHAGGAEAPTMIVVEDKFGFKVDPELARPERDDRVRESSLGVPKKGSAEAGAIEKELEEIRKRRAERVALVKFPDGYTYGDREDDQTRLQQLYSKRCSRKKLTPEEEAEEAHLAVRVLNPVKPPKIKDPLALKGPKGRIYELEKRRVGEILTPAEEDELQDLRRRHPRIAAIVSQMNLVYDYWFGREIEIAMKAGLGIGDAIRQAKDVCLRFQKIGCIGRPMLSQLRDDGTWPWHPPASPPAEPATQSANEPEPTK